MVSGVWIRIFYSQLTDCVARVFLYHQRLQERACQTILDCGVGDSADFATLCYFRSGWRFFGLEVHLSDRRALLPGNGGGDLLLPTARARLTFHRLFLFCERTAIDGFLNVFGRDRYFAAGVAHVDGDHSDLAGGCDGFGGEGLDIGAEADYEIIHGI